MTLTSRPSATSGGLSLGALLRPNFTFVLLWGLLPPFLYLALALARRTWPVALAGALPLVTWGLPQYRGCPVDRGTWSGWFSVGGSCGGVVE